MPHMQAMQEQAFLAQQAQIAAMAEEAHPTTRAFLQQRAQQLAAATQPTPPRLRPHRRHPRQTSITYVRASLRRARVIRA